MKMLFKFCIENKFTLFLSVNTLKCEICMFLKSENTTLKKWMTMLPIDVYFDLL